MFIRHSTRTALVTEFKIFIKILKHVLQNQHPPAPRPGALSSFTGAIYNITTSAPSLVSTPGDTNTKYHTEERERKKNTITDDTVR